MSCQTLRVYHEIIHPCIDKYRHICILALDALLLHCDIIQLNIPSLNLKHDFGYHCTDVGTQNNIIIAINFYYTYKQSMNYPASYLAVNEFETDNSAV